MEVPCQLGGGIRDEATIAQLLQLGLQRLVVGTQALKDPAWFREMCRKFPHKLVAGIDARGGRVATDGWLETSTIEATQWALDLSAEPIAAIVYTDIAKDGMMEGPNLPAMAEMASAVSTSVVASGGVTTASDVMQLAATGVAGCIIGRALYEGSLTLPARWQLPGRELPGVRRSGSLRRPFAGQARTLGRRRNLRLGLRRRDHTGLARDRITGNGKAGNGKFRRVASAVHWPAATVLLLRKRHAPGMQVNTRTTEARDFEQWRKRKSKTFAILFCAGTVPPGKTTLVDNMLVEDRSGERAIRASTTARASATSTRKRSTTSTRSKPRSCTSSTAANTST